MKKYLPIFLDISDKRILIVGGGKIAWQKYQMLKQFTDKITVLSREFLPVFKKARVKKIKADYQGKFLKPYHLIYACTNNEKLNAQINRDANKNHSLVNVVDNKGLCDFITPAIFKRGAMVVAVSSGGSNIKRAVLWRDKIKGRLKND